MLKNGIPRLSLVEIDDKDHGNKSVLLLQEWSLIKWYTHPARSMET
jgi:hypothetical protein